MNSFYNYSLRELEQNTKPKYIAKQLYNWAYKKYTTNYQDMTNISPKEISNLKEKYTLDTLSIADVKISLDKTTKFLFELKDKYIIESVALLMAEKKKDKTGQKIIKSEQITFCISTQVGCKMACSFCKTGEGGWSRDLSVGEIVAQVVRMKEYLKLKRGFIITHCF